MVSTMHRQRTYNSSELSRNSSEVFDAATEHPVTIHRRNAEDFVLMTEERAEAERSLLALAAQLIAISTRTDGTLASRMAEHYPWMLALPQAERDTCAQAVIDASRASFSTSQPHLAIAELHAWKETAEALAAGLGDAPVEWLSEDHEVERPSS